MVWANRDTLAAIAGVFFLLPDLVKALLPSPTLTPDMGVQQISDAVTAFYTDKPLLLVALLLLWIPTLVGYLTVLAVLLDRDRPTVGAAILLGVKLVPGYLASQVIVFAGLIVAVSVAMGILAQIILPGIAIAIGLLAMVYPSIRLVLIGPEIVVRRLYNPFRAIALALAATRGQFASLLLYMVPAAAIFLVVCALVMMAVNPVLALALNGEAQRLTSEAIGAVLSTIGTVYFTAIIASTYDQLGPLHGAGPAISPSSQS